MAHATVSLRCPLAVLVLAALSSCAGARTLQDIGIPLLQEAARLQPSAAGRPHRQLLFRDGVYFEFQTASRISLLTTAVELEEGFIGKELPAVIPAGTYLSGDQSGWVGPDSQQGTRGTLHFQVVNDSQPTGCTLAVHWYKTYTSSGDYSCTVGSGADCDKVLCNVSASGNDHNVLLTSVGNR